MFFQGRWRSEATDDTDGISASFPGLGPTAFKNCVGENGPGALSKYFGGNHEEKLHDFIAVEGKGEKNYSQERPRETLRRTKTHEEAIETHQTLTARLAASLYENKKKGGLREISPDRGRFESHSPHHLIVA